MQPSVGRAILSTFKIYLFLFDLLRSNNYYWRHTKKITKLIRLTDCN